MRNEFERETHLRMLKLKVLVCELLAVDRSAAGTVSVREVSALDHKVWDDAVEGGALEMNISKDLIYHKSLIGFMMSIIVTILPKAK